MPEYKGLDPAPKGSDDSAVQLRHLHSVPSEPQDHGPADDPDGSEGSTRDATIPDAGPEDLVELIVEAVASPAATGTVEWLHATAEARKELEAARAVVKENDNRSDS